MWKNRRSIRRRTQSGKRFSIVVVAEGAMSVERPPLVDALVKARDKADSKKERAEAKEKLSKFHDEHVGHTIRLTAQAGKTHRPGNAADHPRPPAARRHAVGADRVFATWLGTECAEVLNARKYGVMLALQGSRLKHVPIVDVAGNKRQVPADHPLVKTARLVGTSFGDWEGVNTVDPRQYHSE
jgi:ATP-dependent phosphofructokinase / diphosphate-dependent phosphofructokinase